MIFYPVTPHSSVFISFLSLAIHLLWAFGVAGASLLTAGPGSTLIRPRRLVSSGVQARNHQAKANEKGGYEALWGDQ